MKLKASWHTVIFFYFITCSLQGRHPFRIPDERYPEISASWTDHSQKTTMRTPYVRLHPLFTFKTDDFKPNLLPDTISYVGNDKKVMRRKKLSAQIETALRELELLRKKVKKKKELTHFHILQHKNFNFRQPCGLLVLKFKKFPLVVKLFIEKPRTFLDLHATGVEPIFFFYMGGGANRHLSGFTRIKNREVILEKISHLPKWKGRVSVPRKWFWMPKKQKDILLRAKNLAGRETIETRIPSVYAVIADAIDLTEDLDAIPHNKRSDIIMQLCNDLDMYIDPHEKNYVFKKDKNGKLHITIVDTEHFPTMVGILNEKNFENHGSWYTYLAGKCIHDMFFQTKRDLLDAQGKVSLLSLM